MLHLDTYFRQIPVDLNLVLNPGFHVNLQFTDQYYQQPPILTQLRRFLSPADLDRYFAEQAGAYDTPKLSLLDVSMSHNHTELTLTLGSASYFDIFYTHYAPDLDITPSDAPNTLRRLLGTSLDHHYARQLRADRFKPCLELSPVLPNPLGLSSIVLLPAPSGVVYTLLQQRDADVISDKNLWDWAGSGLTEALPWLHIKQIPFTDIVASQLRHEVLPALPVLRDKPYEVAPLGMSLNPLYLYQPELFTTVLYATQDDQFFDTLREQLPEHMHLVPLTHLPELSLGEDVRNTIKPGLAFLQKTHAALFKG